MQHAPLPPRFSPAPAPHKPTYPKPRYIYPGRVARPPRLPPCSTVVSLLYILYLMDNTNQCSQQIFKSISSTGTRLSSARGITSQTTLKPRLGIPRAPKNEKLHHFRQSQMLTSELSPGAWWICLVRPSNVSSEIFEVIISRGSCA